MYLHSVLDGDGDDTSIEKQCERVQCVCVFTLQLVG